MIRLLELRGGAGRHDRCRRRRRRRGDRTDWNLHEEEVVSGAGLTEQSVTCSVLPVKPVRIGSGSVRYETGPNLKFKFEFKKNEKFLKKF